MWQLIRYSHDSYVTRPGVSVTSLWLAGWLVSHHQPPGRHGADPLFSGGAYASGVCPCCPHAAQMHEAATMCCTLVFGLVQAGAVLLALVCLSNILPGCLRADPEQQMHDAADGSCAYVHNGHE